MFIPLRQLLPTKEKVVSVSKRSSYFTPQLLMVICSITGLMPNMYQIRPVRPSINFCRTPEGLPGDCSDVRKCPWLVFNVEKLRQSVCLRNLIVPGVCCPSRAITIPIAPNPQVTFPQPSGLPPSPSPSQSSISSMPAAPFIHSTAISYPLDSPSTTTNKPFLGSSEHQSLFVTKRPSYPSINSPSSSSSSNSQFSVNLNPTRVTPFPVTRRPLTTSTSINIIPSSSTTTTTTVLPPIRKPAAHPWMTNGHSSASSTNHFNKSSILESEGKGE